MVMTVAELIEALQALPQDLPVYVQNHGFFPEEFPLQQAEPMKVILPEVSQFFPETNRPGRVVLCSEPG